MIASFSTRMPTSHRSPITFSPNLAVCDAVSNGASAELGASVFREFMLDILRCVVNEPLCQFEVLRHASQNARQYGV